MSGRSPPALVLCSGPPLMRGHIRPPAPRPDRAVEAMVEMCFPDLVRADREAELSFYRAIGDEPPAALLSSLGASRAASAATAAAEGSPAQASPSAPKKRKTVGDKIRLKLVPHELARPPCVALKSPFIKVSAKASPMHLGKFLVSKLGLTRDQCQSVRHCFRAVAAHAHSPRRCPRVGPSW